MTFWGCRHIALCRHCLRFSPQAKGFSVTVTPSVRQTPPEMLVENAALLAVQSGLQAMLDAVPVALLGFHLQGSELRLMSANAAAHRLEGLRTVRSPGAAASRVFVLMAGTHLLEQLGAVDRKSVV